MEKLIELLLMLVQKAQFNSEAERDEATELLRDAAAELGAPDVVPPSPADANQPAAVPAVDPGPVAEPVPAAEQVPPPVSPDVAVGDVENTNAFSQGEADAAEVPGSP